MSFGYSNDCCLDSGSKWWNLVSSHMTVCDRKPSLPASYWCQKKKVAVAFIVHNCLSLSMHLSAWVALKECRPWNSHAFNLLPLYCLLQWVVYSIIHQLQHDGYCISVHQPGRCEASLQCRYSHSSRSVMKCCCSFFSFCNPCYPSYSTCSEVSLDQSIYFYFNKPFHTLCLLLRVYGRELISHTYIHIWMQCSSKQEYCQLPGMQWNFATVCVRWYKTQCLHFHKVFIRNLNLKIVVIHPV